MKNTKIWLYAFSNFNKATRSFAFKNLNKTPAEERDIFRPELFYNYINEAQE